MIQSVSRNSLGNLNGANEKEYASVNDIYTIRLRQHIKPCDKKTIPSPSEYTKVYSFINNENTPKKEIINIEIKENSIVDVIKNNINTYMPNTTTTTQNNSKEIPILDLKSVNDIINNTLLQDSITSNIITLFKMDETPSTTTQATPSTTTQATPSTTTQATTQTTSSTTTQATTQTTSSTTTPIPKQKDETTDKMPTNKCLKKSKLFFTKESKKYHLNKCVDDKLTKMKNKEYCINYVNDILKINNSKGCDENDINKLCTEITSKFTRQNAEQLCKLEMIGSTKFWKSKIKKNQVK